jgi:hypothetical protein
MKTCLIFASVLMFSISTAAFAVCVMDGKTYQTGAKVGPYTCMPDGQWRR